MSISDEQARINWDREKSMLMESLLGPEHDCVMHAVIPYAIGGTLDLYYYPDPGGMRGTAIATKELSSLPGDGSSNSVFRNYEFVIFSRHPIDLERAHDRSEPFGQTHSAAQAALNALAPYSGQASLNPFDTCEIPAESEDEPSQCIIFDAFPTSPEKSENFGLMAAIRVFPAELSFARENSCRELVDRLKIAGYYPFSDLDRECIA